MPFSTVNPLNTGVNFTVMGRPVIKPALIYCSLSVLIKSLASKVNMHVPVLIVNEVCVIAWAECFFFLASYLFH